MDKKQQIVSMSLIHFLTNGSDCYIKLKNIATGLYLYIDIINSDSNTLEKSAIGNDNGSLLILSPTYMLSKCCFIIPANINTNKTTRFYLTATHDSALLKKTGERTNDSFFYLQRNNFSNDNNSFYICAYQSDTNMFGEQGRYLYMSDDGTIYVNGDPSISSALWKIEKINEQQIIKDVRTDCDKLFDDVVKESKHNLTLLFPDITKYFNVFNVGCKKYLNISIVNEISGENELFGDDTKMNLILRPIPSENCVYISHYVNRVFMNIYTIPDSIDVYAGAPDCNWAKFYIIKRNNQYLFQCFHRESDINGNYGRYLCMKKIHINDNDKYEIFANGSCDEDESKWTLNYSNNL